VYFQVSAAGFVEDGQVEIQERDVNAKSRNRDRRTPLRAGLKVTYRQLARDVCATACVVVGIERGGVL